MLTSSAVLYAELLSKNKFISHVLDSTVDIIGVMDSNGKRILANNAAGKILGTTKNDLIGHSIFDKVYEEDKLKTAGILKAIKELKEVSNFENRLVKNDGTLVYMSWNLHWDKETGFIYLTGRDTSAATQAAATLKESQKRFETYIENATDALFIHDFDGNFIDVNNEACKSLGYTREELLGMCITDVDDEIDLEYAKEAWRKTMQNEPVTIQTRQIKKDGSRIPVEIRFGCFEMDGRVCVMGFVRDISARKLAEEQLLASEKKYKQLFDFSGTGNFLIDSTGKFLDVNKRAASLFNTKPDDVVGKTLHDFFSEDKAKQYLRLVNDLIETGESRKYEGTFDIMGTERTFMITDCVIQNNEGKNFAMLSISHDITERKQAELKLEDSEKRFRMIIENLSVGVIKYKPSTEIMICNKASLKMLGLTKAQLTGVTSYDPLWKVIHEDGTDFPSLIHPVSVVVATGKAVHNVVIGVYRPQTKDSVWLLINAVPQFFNDGTMECITVTFADITEKKKIEAALQAQFKRYRMLMHSSQDFIQILNSNGKLLEWNDAFSKHLGYPEAQLKEMHAWDWSPVFSKEQVMQVLASVKEDGISFEATHLLYDGSIRNVDVKLHKFLSDGEVFFYASARDITELKNRQNEIEEKNKELRGLSVHIQQLVEKERAELAKEIHDEFGQAFVAISMNTELIKEKVKGQNEQLDQLLNEQIELSHKVIAASRMLFNSLYPTMLEDMGLVSAMESYFESSSLKFAGLKFLLTTNLRDKVLAKDISLCLYRIFQEGMTNISLYANAASIFVDLHSDGEKIVLRITDNGKGFDISAVDTKDHHGLLVMRERAYAMGGSLAITSKLHYGTTLEVVIPVTNVQPNEYFL